LSSLGEVLRETLNLFERSANVAFEPLSIELLPGLRVVADSVMWLFLEAEIPEDPGS
jgi:hypothetical protein